MFQKETGREKPKPNQKQTNQHPNRRRTGKIQKLQRFKTNPQPDGAKNTGVGQKHT